MNEQDIKLRTMANLPTAVHGITLCPRTIGEIIGYGYDEYNRHLSLISIRKEDLFPAEVQDKLPQGISVMELLIGLQSMNMDSHKLLQLLVDALAYFCGTKKLDFSSECLLFDGQRVEFAQVDDLIRAIKIQNCLVTPDEESFRPLNERARRIKEKMLQNKKKISELRSSSQEEDSLTLLDLISILCSNANGIHLFNVFDLNFFQFNDQFNRMRLIDEYEVNIQALLHGADAKHIELKHWISKMK